MNFQMDFFMQDVLPLIAFLFLLALSAFSSGTESAVLSLDKASFQKLRKNPTRKKKRVFVLEHFHQKPSVFLSSILLANLIANIPLSALGDSLLLKYLPWHTPWISLTIITLTLLIFGEIFPKVIAIRHSLVWSYYVAPILATWSKLTLFLLRPVRKMADAILARLPDRPPLDEMCMLNAIYESEKLDARSKEQLARWVSFHHADAARIMVPKADIFMIPHTLSPAQARKEFEKSHHSVALIYHEKEKGVIGYLHARHLVALLRQKKKSIRSAIRELSFVPSTLSLADITKIFKESGSDILGVVEETGEFIGMLTLRDIFEFLFFSHPLQSPQQAQPENPWIQVDKQNNMYIIDGEIPMQEFNLFFHSNLQSDYDTLSGFLLERLDGFPQKHTTLQVDSFLFQDMQVDNFRIHKVKVKVASHD
ncbi:MAG: DUF21 domain-containing protein [Candidatus Hydrogenedentota bacterium]|nr:MAG: DUF21 domain-containing protein [Candidatus Hydrogenedentota bacterium]